jgi:uncharacterized protein (UPF0297 family)
MSYDSVRKEILVERKGVVMSKIREETLVFSPQANAGTILDDVCQAMRNRGYNPVDQLAGYLLSGDQSYITSYNDARGLIGQVNRNDLLEWIVRAYLNENDG